MGIEDFETNFRLVKESTQFELTRKKELYTNFLAQLEEVFFKKQV